MGMWQRTPISMSSLCLQGKTENAHRSSYGADAQRETLQAGTCLGQDHQILTLR